MPGSQCGVRSAGGPSYQPRAVRPVSHSRHCEEASPSAIRRSNPIPPLSACARQFAGSGSVLVYDGAGRLSTIPGYSEQRDLQRPRRTAGADECERHHHHEDLRSESVLAQRHRHHGAFARSPEPALHAQALRPTGKTVGPLVTSARPHSFRRGECQPRLRAKRGTGANSGWRPRRNDQHPRKAVKSTSAPGVE